MDNVVMRKIHSESGGAMVELALMTPWILFLFICIYDIGWFSYASICTQNAARTAAVQAAVQLPATANAATAWPFVCTAALGELNFMPNVRGVTSCVATPGAITDTQPVAVSVKKLCVPGSADPTCDASPPCADCNIATCTTCPPQKSWRVEVTYKTDQLFWTPWLNPTTGLEGRMMLTRPAEARTFR